MKHFIMNYPGDPPENVTLMNRQEFKAAHPRTPWKISDLSTGEVLKEIPIDEDEVICDLCNADPIDTIYVIGTGRGYCGQCAKECVLDYCQEVVQ